MPPRSTVKSLPPEIKAELDRLLVLDNFTIDQLVEHLAKLGEDLSRSAVGRYTKNYHNVAARMKQYKETATAFANELGTAVESDAHQIIVQMMHTMLMRVGMAELNNDDPTFKPKDLMLLSASIKNLMGSVKDRQAIQEKERELARREAANDASASMKEAGLSAEQIQFWREEFLGVKPKPKEG